MTSISILKCHGSENTFFLINANDLPGTYAAAERALLSQTLCNTKKGWDGADGILIMENGHNTTYKMRIYNADGSEALMCGNGMRIAGRWALEQEDKNETIVENVTELCYSITADPNFYENITAISIAFPPANFNAKTFLPQLRNDELHQETIKDFHEDILFTAVAMPNPHIVAIVKTIDFEQLDSVGKAANLDKNIFPEGINVSFVKLTAEKNIFVATYERGVGLTNACGTAMIAATITMNKSKHIPKKEWIIVQNKGGFIKVFINEDWSTKMTGNATYIYKTSISQIDLEHQTFEVAPIHHFQSETDAYQQLKIN